MKIKFIPAEFIGPIELDKKALDYLRKEKLKKVGLYAAVQFVHQLEKIQLQLDRLGIGWVTSKPRRTEAVGQVLGCDVDPHSLKLSSEEMKSIDVFLYIGDGKFHPLALLYAGKDVICYDPLAHHITVLNHDLIEKIEKRKKGALLKFYSAQKIGVVITTKPGQQQLKMAFKLEEKYPEKKFYFFVDNTISYGQLENFPFVEVWVNTACPRIGLDDQEAFRKGVLNLKDVL